MNAKRIKSPRLRRKTTSNVFCLRSIPEAELKTLTQKELLTLTRALINVRDGRDISFSIPTVTPKVIACAKKVERLPKPLQHKAIAKVNKLAFENI